MKIRRIAITGPESTGKSLLAEKLALHFQTLWVPEYSREYLENLGRPYKKDDILAIAKGQLALEEKAMKRANGWLFCDTEFLVTKIWSEVKYSDCDPWILKQVDNHRYDFYLLCEPDIPWEPDPLREHPEMRDDLFERYYNELVIRKYPFALVNGLGDIRLQRAIDCLMMRFK